MRRAVIRAKRLKNKLRAREAELMLEIDELRSMRLVLAHRKGIMSSAFGSQHGTFLTNLATLFESFSGRHEAIAREEEVYLKELKHATARKWREKEEDPGEWPTWEQVKNEREGSNKDNDNDSDKDSDKESDKESDNDMDKDRREDNSNSAGAGDGVSNDRKDDGDRCVDSVDIIFL